MHGLYLLNSHGYLQATNIIKTYGVTTLMNIDIFNAVITSNMKLTDEEVITKYGIITQ
jgi:hypothetical protein